jgi:hypothetical protein
MNVIRKSPFVLGSNQAKLSFIASVDPHAGSRN